MNPRALVVVACFVLAGCSSVPFGTSSPTDPPVSGSPTVDAALCALVTLDDVRAKTPFQTPLVTTSGDDDKCEYRSDEDSGDQVSIVIEATDYASSKRAKAALDDARQAAVDHGLPVDAIDGLGDIAFSSGVDEVSVQAVAGERLVTATLQGEWPDTTDDAKVAAGTELVRTVISRLST